MIWYLNIPMIHFPQSDCHNSMVHRLSHKWLSGIYEEFIPNPKSIQISYTLWFNIVMENHHSLLCSRRAQCDEVKTPMPELKEHPEGPVIGKRWETGWNIWMNMMITYWISWNNVVSPCKHSNYSNSSSFTRNWCYEPSVKKWLSLGLPYCPSFGENQHA